MKVYNIRLLRERNIMFFGGISPDAHKCCGCSACQQICPKKAISWKVDACGFYYPEVDMSECIECGLCEKVCPMLHSDDALQGVPMESYAAVCKDRDELMHSSSGGMFFAIADYVLRSGGVVFGAAFTDDFKLHHIGISRIEDLPKIQKSKYLQSHNESVYTEIRDLLKKDVTVYYAGTGCQVAGLKLFLRKPYDNLITTDILCHGVPPQAVFDVVVLNLERHYGGKLIRYDFRDKSVWGWSCSSSSSIDRGGKSIYVGNDKLQDGYFNAFIKGVNYRESCYVCPFACGRRAGDLTLGDFWGVENYIPVPDIRSGVSALLVNTEQGKKLLEHLRNSITLYPAKTADIEVINKTLSRPTSRPPERDEFFSKFHSDPLDTLMSYSESNWKRDLVYMLKRNKLTNCGIKIIKSFFKK